MSKIKLSNEAVIAAAKKMVRRIQCKRHIEELTSLEWMLQEFDNHDWKWVFQIRGLWDFFNEVPPLFIGLILIGPVLYPLSVLLKTIMMLSKGKYNGTPLRKIKWLSNWDTDYGVWELECDSHSRQEETCIKLKCMAENNEDDHMWVDREEAVCLGIC